MFDLIFHIILLTLSIMMVAAVLPGMKVKDLGTSFKVAIVYSIVNFLIGWILTFLSFPLIILSFGLFIFVINGFLLWITNALLEDFEIEGCGTAIIAALLLALVNMILHWIF